MPNKINVHVYPSQFVYETRILRITKSLIEDKVFDQIIILASLQNSNLPIREKIDDFRTVIRIPTLVNRAGLFSKIINMLEWNIRAFFLLRGKKIACINAHSLSVLPISALIKHKNNSRLVYDAHEIETETTETKGLRQRVSKIVERVLMKYVDVICLTSDGHANWYSRNFEDVVIRVVRNCPYIGGREAPAKDSSLFRNRFSIPAQDLIFLYQGSISKPRGTDLIMRVFEKLPPSYHIVFMGFGPGVSEVKKFEAITPNIHYLPAVHPNDVSKYTSGADVGIHMMDDSCENHLYALPNKPMEYMNAGLPAIVTDLPEMGKLIKDARSGWVVPINDEGALYEVVLNITSEAISTFSKGSRDWALLNNWESEVFKLHDLYAALGFSCNEQV